MSKEGSGCSHPCGNSFEMEESGKELFEESHPHRWSDRVSLFEGEGLFEFSALELDKRNLPAFFQNGSEPP